MDFKHDKKNVCFHSYLVKLHALLCSHITAFVSLRPCGGATAQRGYRMRETGTGSGSEKLTKASFLKLVNGCCLGAVCVCCVCVFCVNSKTHRWTRCYGCYLSAVSGESRFHVPFVCCLTHSVTLACLFYF